MLLLVFFGLAGVVLSDKIFAANDAISWESFRPYVAQTNAMGESPMWIPYIFSGMPAFGSYLVTGDRWWDLGMKLVDVAEHVHQAVLDRSRTAEITDPRQVKAVDGIAPDMRHTIVVLHPYIT